MLDPRTLQGMIGYMEHRLSYRVFLLTVKILCGLGLGLLVIELSLRINPYLFHKAEFGGNVPLYAPMQNKVYDIHYSNGDAFTWSSAIVAQPADDMLEEHVNFLSDEFGFANPAPVPVKVDMIVLGRSHSAGANVAQSWSRLLESQLNIKVENLSQPYNESFQKLAFLRTYGFPLHPKWVVFEVIAAYDLLQSPAVEIPSLRISRVLVPALTQFQQKFTSVPLVQATNPIYPLNLYISGQSVPVVFYPPYLQAMTANSVTLSESNQWQQFKDYTATFSSEIRSHSACLILLYAPMKPEVYLPLSDPSDLLPAIKDIPTYTLDVMNNLVLKQLPIDPDKLQNNTTEIRQLLSEFAQVQAIPFVDPTEDFQKSVMDGQTPFFLYDTHWNGQGHKIVADALARTIMAHQCEEQ